MRGHEVGEPLRQILSAGAIPIRGIERPLEPCHLTEPAGRNLFFERGDEFLAKLAVDLDAIKQPSLPPVKKLLLLLSGRSQITLLRIHLGRLISLNDAEIEVVLAATIAMEVAETAMAVAGKPMGGGRHHSAFRGRCRRGGEAAAAARLGCVRGGAGATRAG